MLNEVFETLTASLRSRGGNVLKFIGDAMLATISFEGTGEMVACGHGLDAAVEALDKVKSRNLERRLRARHFRRRHRAACGRSAVRQRRRRRPARLHRDRTSGQRSGSHGKAVRSARPAAAFLVPVRRGRRTLRRTSGVARTIPASRRQPAKGNLWSSAPTGGRLNGAGEGSLRNRRLTAARHPRTRSGRPISARLRVARPSAPVQAITGAPRLA